MGTESDVFLIVVDVSKYDSQALARWIDASDERGWLWHEALAEGYSVEDVASMAADGFDVPDVPCINLTPGDPVAYPAAGGGVLEGLYEGVGLLLVGRVRLGGWFWDVDNECYTLTDTGVPAVLPIRAADLRRKGD